jgi:hypothetical protein
MQRPVGETSPSRQRFESFEYSQLKKGELSMNFQSAIAASCLSIFLLSSPAQAAQTIVTFEDVATSATSSPLYATGDVADGYKGISGWSAAGQVWEFLDGTDFGEIGARFFYGTSGELRFDLAPVVFEGTFYQSYAADPFNPITSFELYYKGQLVHSILDPLANAGMVWVASGYSGLVDKVYIRGGLEGYSIDNLTYSVAAVPEPETYAMFLLGFGLIGLMHRRRGVARLPG